MNILVKEVSVFSRAGTDIITLILDDQSAFPNVGYDTGMRIDAQKGKGVEWCKKNLGINPRVVDEKKGLINKGEPFSMVLKFELS